MDNEKVKKWTEKWKRENWTKKNWIILGCVALVIVAAIYGGRNYGKVWKCSECKKEFRGTAYYEFSMDVEKGVLCEDCAREYWAPLPYKNYKVS